MTALAIVGIFIARTDAPLLFGRLVGAALPLVGASIAAGVASLVLLALRRFTLVRITAALAVAAVLWGWGLARYLDLLLPGLTVAQAAAPHATLLATAISVAIGWLCSYPPWPGHSCCSSARAIPLAVLLTGCGNGSHGCNLRTDSCGEQGGSLGDMGDPYEGERSDYLVDQQRQEEDESPPAAGGLQRRQRRQRLRGVTRPALRIQDPA